MNDVTPVESAATQLRRADARGLRVRLHHRAARHAGDRHHHSGAAKPDRRLHGRRRGGRRGNPRPVRHRLGADAVPVLADARRAVGSLRTTPGDPDLRTRPRPRLHPDGARALALVAVRRPRHLRHHGGEHLDRLCLRGGRDAAGEARRALRHARRRVRCGLRVRSCARRACRRRSIRACRSGSRPCSASRMRSTAGWSCRSRCRRSGACRSHGRAPIRSARSSCCARIANCSGSRASTSSAISRMRCCRAMGVLYMLLSLRLGRAHGRPRDGGRRALRHRGAGRADRPGGQAARRAQGADRRTAVRRMRLFRLRRCADRHRCFWPAFR